MTKERKIKYAQLSIAASWSCPEDTFVKNENAFFETDTTFFEIITFGYNTVIRADKRILDWCIENFANTPASEIVDGENLFNIEKKLRDYGKKLAGEHLNFLHLHPEINAKKPNGFTYELYEKDRIPELYLDNRFDNALGDDSDKTELAIIARKEGDIAAIAAVDSHHHGLWQMGIDTVDIHRGKGLATYLIKELAIESEKRNQVPFYATWSANIASMRTTLSAGFSPVWVKYFAEDMQ